MKIILIVLLITSKSILASPLVKQGDSVVNMEDIDGFAYTIPTIDRYGFFQSNKRLDNLIGTLLNMQHLINHAKDEEIKIDYKTIANSAKNIARNKITNLGIEFSVATDNKTQLIENFYFNKLTSEAIQEYYLNNIQDSDLLERAEELYKYNKKRYTVKKNYDIQILSFAFNEENENIQKKKAQKLLDKLILKTINFKEIEEKLFKDYAYIEIYKNINNYFYNENDEIFSDIIFSQTETGLKKNLFYVNDRIVIIDIRKITPVTLLEFNKVKTKIIDDLKLEKFSRDYKVLIMELTKDEAELDDDQIMSVKERYKNSE